LHIADLKAKLINIQIQPKEKVANYFGRIMALKNELGTLGDKSISDVDVYSAFLRGVKGRHEFKITYSTLKNARLTILQIRNNLASAGVDYNDKQLLLHVLNGLPADYEPVRASLVLEFSSACSAVPVVLQTL
jgi:hypothetical protein